MDIYIKWKNDTKGFRLPVNPEKYSLDGKQQNTSVNIHAAGEYNLKGKRALQTISWSCFFPAQKYYFNITKFQDPITFYVKKLTNLLNDNTTVHVMIGDRVNLFATIDSFTWGEEDGTGDIFYSISFKEDRAYAEAVGKAASDAFDGEGKRLAKEVTKVTYKWKKGDTWKKVCKAKLGNAKYAKANQKANKKVINKAKKAYKKKHPKVKTVKEATALIGYKVVLKKT